MSGGFSFPPPPPPPPKAAQEWNQQRPQYDSQDRGRGRGRGRERGGFDGRERGGFEGRGRGSSRARGNSQQPQQRHQNGILGSQQGSGSMLPNGQRDLSSQQSTYQQVPMNQLQHQTQHYLPTLPPGAYVNPAFTGASYGNSTNASYDVYNAPRPCSSSNGSASRPPPHSASPPRTAAGHKRKLDALRGPQPPREKLSGPQTAPAVPSFGFFSLPAAPASLPVQPERPSRDGQLPRFKPVFNPLGLTPAGNDPQYSSSEDEEKDDEIDEEVQHAELGTKLTFEHNGVIMSLTSQADLAAWKLERARKFPTQARMTVKEEERYRIGRERKRLLSEAVALRRPRPQQTPDRREDPKRKGGESSSATKNDAIQGGKGLSTVAPVTDTKPDKSHVELSAQARDTKEAENADQAGAGESDDASSVASSDTDSSSAISSDSPSEPDSDSDGSPEEVSSKPAATGELGSQQRLCRYYVASGRCRDGDACRYRHELPARGSGYVEPERQRTSNQRQIASQLPPIPEVARKSIHQRLVEQEQEENGRLALQVIKYLGKAGFFKAQTASGEVTW